MLSWRYYKVMKDLWFIDKDEDIWKVSEDYSCCTIYYKHNDYTKSTSWETTKKNFIYCKRMYKLKEISEGDAFLEIL